MVDATVGSGGHAALLAERIGKEGVLIGLDVDPSSLEISRQVLSGCLPRIELVQANFAELPGVLHGLDIERVDVLLADLGVSSAQLDDPTRGLSFQSDGPLDMRLDPRLRIKASDLINRLSEKELGDVFYENAQEFAGRRIARRICEVRREGRITTTGRLASAVADALGVDPQSRKSKIHPATRAFLALRMAVNDEVPNLEALLRAAPGILRPGGRIGVIAFHSVEDKVVKMQFRAGSNEGIYEILTKKPVVAGEPERQANPRSRSAKFRVARRTGQP